MGVGDDVGDGVDTTGWVGVAVGVSPGVGVHAIRKLSTSKIINMIIMGFFFMIVA